MDPRFTDEQVMTTLREVVNERPEYTYEAPADLLAEHENRPVAPVCFYVHGDEPGCIVGQVLYRLGVPLETMRAWEGKGIASAVPNVGEWVTGRAAEALARAQNVQDGGCKWSEALEAAEWEFGRE